MSSLESDLVALGERFVAGASPRFKDFRVDFEKISNAASRTMRVEEDDLDLAKAMYFDTDWALRLPLQRRYAAVGAWEPLVKYHLTRTKRYWSSTSPFPDEPAQAVLDLFAEHGRADLGLTLVRTHVEVMLKRLRRDLSKRNPRGPGKQYDEATRRILSAMDAAVAAHIPESKRDLLRDLEAVEPYVMAHGSKDDHAWFAEVRREVWMERRA
ncbi:hypothetical protein [Knoellia sp. p5-6-4]|uniref:hypothetical protein n=1 Tax=unclassified Knoellia TaxID=2618719 RepID=UPI0023DC831B|nr:hypothetical protein [Knoellia sp. p5-6-4]MDF2146584.1 hypothetical protein [Knoellia sp. p5-6-4]